MMIIKPLAAEISVTAANTVSNSKLVRAYAVASSVLTIRNAEAAVIGSFTVPAGEVVIVEKNKTDTIEGTTALLCTPVSYKS